MQTDYVKQWSEFGNSALSTIKEWGDLTTKVTDKLAQQQLDFASSCMDFGVKGMTLVGESKGYKEFLSGQASLASEYNDLVMENLRKTADIFNESKEGYTTLLEKGAHFFSKTMETSVSAKTTKKAA